MVHCTWTVDRPVSASCLIYDMCQKIYGIHLILVNHKYSQNMLAKRFHSSKNNQSSFNFNPKVDRLNSMWNNVL